MEYTRSHLYLKLGLRKKLGSNHLSCKGHFTPHNSSRDLPITNIAKSSHPPLGAKPHNAFRLPKTNSTKLSHPPLGAKPHNAFRLPKTNSTKFSHPPLGAKPQNVFRLPKTNSTKPSATRH
jgi:hypothetical protein